MTLSLLCFLRSLLLRLRKDKVFFSSVGVQQVVRNQTEYGAQTEFRKYRVKGQMLYNSAHLIICHTHTYLYDTPIYTDSHKCTHKQKIKTIFMVTSEPNWTL